MTIPMVVTVVAMAVWAIAALAESPSKGLAWLGEVARLTFFAGMLATLLGLSGKIVF